MKRPARWLIAAAVSLLCVIWGTTWATIQIGLRGIPPLSGVAIRFAIASVLILAVTFARGVRLGSKPKERRLWLVNGFLAFSLSYGLVYWAEQWVPSGLAAILFATYPLFVALIAHIFLPAEPLARLELFGILLGFGGVGVIFSADFAALGGKQVAIAAAIMLVSPIVSAVASVAVKRWGAGIHPFSLTAVPMAIAGVVMGVAALAFERGATLRWDPVSVSALLYLAVFGSAVTFTLYYWLLSHLPVKRLALIAYVIPIIAVLIGALRGEPLTPRVLGGALLVIVGVALAVHRPATSERRS